MSENHTTEISITCDDVQDELVPLFIGELIRHELIDIKDVETQNWNTLFVDGDFDVEVDYDWSPGCAGSMYRSNGDPGDPPEPETFDINSAIIFTGDASLIERSARARGIMMKYKKKLKTRHSLRKQLHKVACCDEIDMLEYVSESEIISLIEDNGEF